MASGYCNHCQQHVLAKREDINILLAIILAIFTAIIGLLIYMSIWKSKPENRCVHCNSIISPPTEAGIPSSESQFSYDNPIIPENPYTNIYIDESIEEGESEEEGSEVMTRGRSEFCSLCGEKIELGVRFCPSCGNKI